MNRFAHLLAWIIVASLGIACTPRVYPLAANPTPYTWDEPTEYFLYLPSSYTPEHAWPMFVGIHGFGGSGLGCLDFWQEYAEQEGFVLVCPSMADEGGGWYIEDGERLLDEVIKQVRQQARVQKRFFLAGFSAGAEFVQAYAFDFPGSVAAVAVLSAGNYYEPSRWAKRVPFLVVIGEQDNPISLKNARMFAELLEQGGYAVNLHVLPGIGHQISVEAKELTIEFYRQAFRKPGE